MAHDEQVIGILMEIKQDIGEIKTNMVNLIGRDGNNGRVGTLEDEVDLLKQSHNRRVGGVAVVGTAIGSAITVIAQHFWKH